MIKKKIGPIKAYFGYDSIWSHHGVREAVGFRNETDKKIFYNKLLECVNPLFLSVVHYIETS